MFYNPVRYQLSNVVIILCDICDNYFTTHFLCWIYLNILWFSWAWSFVIKFWCFLVSEVHVWDIFRVLSLTFMFDNSDAAENPFYCAKLNILCLSKSFNLLILQPVINISRLHIFPCFNKQACTIFRISRFFF